MHPTSGQASPDLRGLLVLVVEDDFLLARSLERTLVSVGAEVVGPVSTTEAALLLVEESSIDVGLLDVMLREGTSAPVASELIAGGCPVLFLTGFHTRNMLPEHLRGVPCLEKPVDRDELLEAILLVSKRRR